MSRIRLDKFLADAGIGTRSQVKEYLRKGRITVNGQTVRKPELKIDEERDAVLFDQKEVRSLLPAYYLFHKPAGSLTAVTDTREKTVMDYFSSAPEKGLFPVGRLDKDTEGLLLITNDGAFAHSLLSPRRHVEKTYYAKVEGALQENAEELFLKGVDIQDEKPTLPSKLIILEKTEQTAEILLTIYEGRYHQVKRMIAAAGGKVVYLKRLSFGGIKLDETLEKGSYRRLTEEELAILKKQAAQTKKEREEQT